MPERRRQDAYAWIILLLALLLAGLLLLAFAAYQASPGATPAAPATATPAPSGTLTATASPVALTPTRSAAPTQIPATATPRATATLEPPHISLHKGPYLIYTGNNTEMRVVWQLDARDSARLQWGTDTGYATGSVTTGEYTPDHLHAYTIAGLAPGTRYFYRVLAGGGYTDGSFYTAPPADAADLKFFAYGDTRTHPEAQDAVAGRIVATYAADPGYQTLALIVGDLVSSGDDEGAWTAEFFDPRYAHIRALLANTAYLPVMGNHEGSGGLFGKYFPMPFVADRYWSFDYGPIHVAMVDQYVPYGVGTPQYDWLRRDLSASTKAWKFIVLHEPGWSAGGGHDNNVTVQVDLQPLAVQYGVAFVLGGHNHYYARAVVDGVQHLTLGTGGAPLYTPDRGYPNVVAADSAYGFARFEIRGNTLVFTAERTDGSTMDALTLTR